MANMDNTARTTQINPHTMDKDYNLVSVLYHTLQAVDTCAQYEQDARSEGSPEIADFMRTCKSRISRSHSARKNCCSSRSRFRALNSSRARARLI